MRGGRAEGVLPPFDVRGEGRGERAERLSSEREGSEGGVGPLSCLRQSWERSIQKTLSSPPRPPAGHVSFLDLLCFYVVYSQEYYACFFIFNIYRYVQYSCYVCVDVSLLSGCRYLLKKLFSARFLSLKSHLAISPIYLCINARSFVYIYIYIYMIWPLRVYFSSFSELWFSRCLLSRVLISGFLYYY
jgi:hypothetical protein